MMRTDEIETKKKNNWLTNKCIHTNISNNNNERLMDLAGPTEHFNCFKH